MNRLRGYKVPVELRTATSVIVDINGFAHHWDHLTGVLCNVEAIAERLDEPFVSGPPVPTPP